MWDHDMERPPDVTHRNGFIYVDGKKVTFEGIPKFQIYAWLFRKGVLETISEDGVETTRLSRP